MATDNALKWLLWAAIGMVLQPVSWAGSWSQLRNATQGFGFRRILGNESQTACKYTNIDSLMGREGGLLFLYVGEIGCSLRRQVNGDAIFEK